jgi:hypothetical protein
MRIEVPGTSSRAASVHSGLDFDHIHSLAVDRIDGPKAGNTHPAVILEALGYASPAVFRGHDLDAQDGRVGDDLLERILR